MRKQRAQLFPAAESLRRGLRLFLQLSWRLRRAEEQMQGQVCMATCAGAAVCPAAPVLSLGAGHLPNLPVALQRLIPSPQYVSQHPPESLLPTS